MDQASRGVKDSSMAQGQRYGILMKYLYPNDPGKRYRDPMASGVVKGKAGSSASGEEFFEKNFGKRRGMD